MADQIPDQGGGQEDLYSAHAIVADETESETTEEEEDTEQTTQNLRRLPEESLWCLTCHQVGHRAQDCMAIPPEIPRVNWSSLISTKHLGSTLR